MKKFLFAGLVIAILACGVFWFNWPKEKALGGVYLGSPVDVVGTKTGTSTAGVYFGDYAATSTYVTNITAMADMAIYTLRVKSASTTAAAYFEIQGSYDAECGTTATSTTDAAYKPRSPLMSDINWYDASSHIEGLADTRTIATATTTLVWTSIVAGMGREITLTDLNYDCLRLGVRATSTILWVQLKTKGSF